MMKEAQAAASQEAKKLGKTKPLIFGVTVLTSLAKPDLLAAGIAGSPEAQVKRLASLARKAGLDAVVASGLEIKTVRKAIGRNMFIGVPGIRPAEERKKDDQKRVMTPEAAIKAGADYLIVGRPILEAEDRVQTILKIARAFQ